MPLTGAEGGRNRDRMTAGGRTAFWWDMESCPLPSSSDPYIVTAMPSALLHRFGISNVKAVGGGLNPHDHFSAYEFFSHEETELDQTLINSGVRLQQLPPGNASEIEKMIAADALLWAMDTPPPANIVFIVGSVDLSYLFEKLLQRSYNVFLVSSSGIQVPQGMLNAANDFMGWFSFLQSLENQIQQLHFPSAHGVCGVHDRTFSDAAIPSSLTSIELEESHNRSGCNYVLENSFGLPYFSGGWNSTNSSSSNETGKSSVHNREQEESHNRSGFNYGLENSISLPYFSGGWNSTNSPSSNETGRSSVHNREQEESHNRSGFNYGLENSISLPYFSGGWNSTNSLSSNETGRSSVQADPGFHGHFITTEKPKRPPLQPPSIEKHDKPPLLPLPSEKPNRPPLLPSTTDTKNPGKILSPSMTNVSKKKSGPFIEFKAWLGGVIKSEEYEENGYNISGIRKDFQKATGKILDEQALGFLKIIDLVKECKDVAVVKEVKKSCHVAFPIVKPNKQNNLGLSLLWANPNSKPKKETDPRQKLIASMGDFRKYIHQMVFTGQFSQGFLMSCLPQNFKERTGKFLDVNHLGYQKLSELVASYSHLVSVNSPGSGPVRLFPAGFVSQAVYNNNPNCNTTNKETSMNMHHGGSKELKAKAEVYSISSGVSTKGLAENIAPTENISGEHLFYINSDDLHFALVEPANHLLPSMSVTLTEANAESPFQGHSIKPDSSNTPGGSQVSELEEGHSSASSTDDSDQVEAYEFIM